MLRWGLPLLASSRIWAGLLNRYRGGQSLSILNALLSLAYRHSCHHIFLAHDACFRGVVWGCIFVGGCLYHGHGETQPGAFTVGGRYQCFHSHLCPVGQIIGPTAVGWIADGPGGLQRGLLFSSAALLIGAVLAWQQKPVQKS